MAVTTTNATIKNANLSTWSPTTLFAAGEQGAWYDPSDLNTMFQDSAGTTPVTAVEQPVGLIRDKSGRGNNASQSTSASRPVLSARYNLLEKTEQFDDAYWFKGAVSVSANTSETTDPLGGNTADKIIPNTSATSHYVAKSAFTGATNFVYQNSAYIKAGGYGFASLSDAVTGSAVINLSTGVVVSKDATITTATTQDAGNGWWRVFITYTATSSRGFGIDPYSDGNKTTFAGNGTSGIYVWGASLTVSNDGVAIPYQRVNTSTDYDSNPNLFPYYLRFDGTDDGLVTGNIDFSNTNKTCLFTGIRKLASLDYMEIAETSANPNSNNGTFGIWNATVGAQYNGYGNLIRGTSSVAGQSAQSYAAPITNVISSTYDLSASTAATASTMRVNAFDINYAATSGTSPGGGNFASNQPLYIGRRGGSTYPFNGRLYSLIVRGASSTAAQISNAEQWVNGKTKAY